MRCLGGLTSTKAMVGRAKWRADKEIVIVRPSFSWHNVRTPANYNMRTEDMRRLASKPFLREIHHFLWMEPFYNRGQLDQGWNCRDHALVTALVIAMRGTVPLLWTVRQPSYAVLEATGNRSCYNKTSTHGLRF